MQIAGRPSDGWAKGRPDEAVFFGLTYKKESYTISSPIFCNSQKVPNRDFFGCGKLNMGSLWKTRQKKSKKVGTNLLTKVSRCAIIEVTNK